MAAKTKDPVFDATTFTVSVEQKKQDEPMVTVYLPKLEDEGSGGFKVDQYEHVTIANEEHEKTYYVHRGERVDVPVSVFMVLKEKYPDL